MNEDEVELVTKTQLGESGESRALAHLQSHGMRLLSRNYRVAHGPHARGAELDLVMRDRDGTLVFVEVRARKRAVHGGAAASVSVAKQRRLIYAAHHYLSGLASWPPCRFDVIAIDAGAITWLRAAFDATA